MVLIELALLGLLIWWISSAVRQSLKSKQAHTEPRKAPLAPPTISAPLPPPTAGAAPKPMQEAAVEPLPQSAVPRKPVRQPALSQASVPSEGKISAQVTYVKADGSRSSRDVTLYSRRVVNGRTHAVNIREDGQSLTKQFLVEGFERLQVSPNIVLDDARSIREWIDENLPLKADRAVRKPKLTVQEPLSSPKPSASTKKVSIDVSAQPLDALLPKGCKGFAVFDLETTGINTDACRIVEVAVVCVDPNGRISEVWESLVNPEEKIPERAAEIHQIRNRDVGRAPIFRDLASLLAAKIDGRVLVAHNLSFDLPILARHFRDHSSVQLDPGDGICTLEGFPGNPDNAFKKKLADLCAVQKVAFDPALAHTALGDALPLAKALVSGLSHLKASAASVEVQSKLILNVPFQHLARSMLSSLPETGWERIALLLKPGQVFSTTGPATRKKDTPIRRAQAHAEKLGLQYVKVNSFSKKSPPDFLLSTSLELENTKMTQARERRIPIVLIDQVHQLTTLEHSVTAWLSSEE